MGASGGAVSIVAHIERTSLCVLGHRAPQPTAIAAVARNGTARASSVRARPTSRAKDRLELGDFHLARQGKDTPRHAMRSTA
jgi:hypothetical protein